MNQNAVLLVEDEAFILLDVQAGLEEQGFKVACAKNAKEAIALFDEDPSAISALVTDIRLGDGALGWEVARHLRQTVPTMPVVYMSGDSASNWHSEGVPGSVMIQKPFVLAQIVTAVATLLNQQPPIVPDSNP
ncbi:MAG: response regulator [Mesorhizobium sp.]|uniref:response regulator n=1 Tax=Mesorhizobium sp. TaxID=1871066 RepID=UPI001AC19761|nr:response regulator [Mesorhizobium sp.]MBN9219317.1 response regulator [Mesorhizobium sp.]